MLESPQVFRRRGLSFRMFFNERTEPPHVHVTRGSKSAKFWLRPLALDDSCGFRPSELKDIRDVLRSNLGLFMEQWHAIQSRKAR